MLNQKTKLQKGFTIIEVLIVLAIAGLIIAIVLFAVPQLQRNARNTAIRNDANNIVATVSDFESNNDGAAPTQAASSVNTSGDGVITIMGATGAPAKGKMQAGTAVTPSSGVPNSPLTPTNGTILVDFGTKCPDTVSGTSVTPVVSARSVAAVYALESSGSALVAKCVSN